MKLPLCTETFQALVEVGLEFPTRELLHELTPRMPSMHAPEAPPREELPHAMEFVMAMDGTAATPASLSELRKKAIRSDAAVFTSMVLGPVSSTLPDVKTPIGKKLSTVFPTGFGPVPLHIPIVATYQRIDPAKLPRDKRFTLGGDPVTPENLVMDYYRNEIVEERNQRDLYEKNGVGSFVYIEYGIGVSDGQSKGEVRSLEMYVRELRPGNIDESQSALLDNERAGAALVASEGSQIVTIPREENQPGRRTADMRVVPSGSAEPFRLELKTPQDEPGKPVDSKTVQNIVWKSMEGGGQSPNILIDGRESSLTLEEAQRSAFRIAGKLKDPQYARYRERLKYLRIVGMDQGARYDLRFDFHVLTP